MTLRPSAGSRSLAESNQTRCWLLPEEEEVVLEFALENASWGWPLSKERIKAHVDKIYRARLGRAFPEKGVGMNWVDRFLKRHENHIQTYRAYPLKPSVERLSTNTHTRTTLTSSSTSSKQEIMETHFCQKTSMEVTKLHFIQARGHQTERSLALRESESNISKKQATERTSLLWLQFVPMAPPQYPQQSSSRVASTS